MNAKVRESAERGSRTRYYKPDGTVIELTGSRTLAFKASINFEGLTVGC